MTHTFLGEGDTLEGVRQISCIEEDRDVNEVPNASPPELLTTGERHPAARHYELLLPLSVGLTGDIQRSVYGTLNPPVSDVNRRVSITMLTLMRPSASSFPGSGDAT